MARKDKNLVKSEHVTLPSTVASRLHQVSEIIGESGKGFSRDTFLLAVVAVSAIGFGRGDHLVLAFATFFLLWVPILRYLGVIDRTGRNRP